MENSTLKRVSIVITLSTKSHSETLEKRKTVVLAAKRDQRQNRREVSAVVPLLCAVVLVPWLLGAVLLGRCGLAAAAPLVLAPAGCMVVLPASAKVSPALMVVARVLTQCGTFRCWQLL